MIEYIKEKFIWLFFLFLTVAIFAFFVWVLTIPVKISLIAIMGLEFFNKYQNIFSFLMHIVCFLVLWYSFLARYDIHVSISKINKN